MLELRQARSWEVPTDELNMDRVAELLTVQNLSAERNRRMGIPVKGIEYIELWDHREDGFTEIPRGFKLSEVLKEGPPRFKPVRHETLRQLTTFDKCGTRFGRLPASIFLRGLWEEQKTILETMRAQSAAGRIDHLIQLGCGRGKTTLALRYASDAGAKTLIVVDQTFIADQWDDEIYACTRTPRKAIGRVQEKKATVGSRWTVATAQTLAARLADGTLDQAWTEQFDLIIVDEVHVFAAPSFLDILPRFVCRRLGLSATPNRKDGLQKAFLFHLGGEEATYTNTARRSSARWIFVPTPPIVPPGVKQVPDYRVDPKTKETKKNRMAYLYKSMGQRYSDGSQEHSGWRLEHSVHRAFAARSDAWNTQIVRDVQRAVATGRYVIVLGPNVEHLETLHKLLVLEGVDAGIVTGKVKQRERQDVFKNRQVLLATDKLAYKALNIPTMNTLFVLYPVDDENWLMQASGRIDRGSVGPVIYSYVHSYIRQSVSKSLRMYHACRELDPGGRFFGWYHDTFVGDGRES